MIFIPSIPANLKRTTPFIPSIPANLKRTTPFIPSIPANLKRTTPFIPSIPANHNRKTRFIPSIPTNHNRTTPQVQVCDQNVFGYPGFRQVGMRMIFLMLFTRSINLSRATITNRRSTRHAMAPLKQHCSTWILVPYTYSLATISRPQNWPAGQRMFLRLIVISII